MRTVLVSIIVLFGFQGQSQSFQAIIQRANHLYDQGEYLRSAQEYQRAFELQSGTAGQFYNAACSWALAGDTLQALLYLNIAADKSWHDLPLIKQDKDLTSLHTTKGWSQLLARVEKNYFQHEENLDLQLKAKLEQIYVRDQTLRQLYQNAEEKFGKDSEELKFFWETMARQDSVNLAETLEILEEKGWVGTSVVGGKANMALWLVIQHAPIEVQERFLPALKNSVLHGESSGRHLALLVDRIQLKKNLPQVYGSQLIPDQKTGREIVYEVIEPEFVNHRRRIIGLGPIEDYLKPREIEWNIEQKEP